MHTGLQATTITVTTLGHMKFLDPAVKTI